MILVIASIGVERIAPVTPHILRRGKQDEKSASIRMRECRRMRDGRRA
jgi:hypothetical protein